MKIIVYTANIGEYDLFNHPSVVDPNVRYILFTDNKFFKSDVWEVCHIDFLEWLPDDRLKSRYIKINPHIILPEHDISIWIDHTFTPKVSNFANMLKENNFDSISIYKHRIRKCIYDEGHKVIEAKKEHPSIVDKQMNKYKDEGYPKNNGLFETGFIFRKNDEKLKTYNNIWWSEIINGSGRDQLSQNYVSWKTGISVTPIKKGKSVYDNPYLSYKPHINNYQVT